MTPRDLVRLALSALGQQKVRTALTVLGVTIGTFALVASLSVGRGIDRAIVGLFHDTDALRKVRVDLKYDTPKRPDRVEPEVSGISSTAQRDRIRRVIERRRRWDGAVEPVARIDQAGLTRLREVPHVVAVEPTLGIDARAELVGGPGTNQHAVVVSATAATPGYRDRILVGSPLDPARPRGVLVHEYLLYRWGLADGDGKQALGRTIRVWVRRPRGEDRPSLVRLLRVGGGLEPNEAESAGRAIRHLAPLLPLLPLPRAEATALRRALARLDLGDDQPATAATESEPEEFTILGVFRVPNDKDERPGLFGSYRLHECDVIMDARTAEAFAWRSGALGREGFSDAILTVDEDVNVEATAEAAELLGFESRSLAPIIATIRTNVMLISFATSFVALVALGVAALGITNTMIMAVLERTREIGVMKALGARDGHVQGIFLIEGALIGVLGGALGVLLAWFASFPGDTIARGMIESQARRTVDGPIFVYPPWLTLGGVAVACLVTTLAAFYPARRAARVDPVSSLRHE